MSARGEIKAQVSGARCGHPGRTARRRQSPRPIWARERAAARAPTDRDGPYVVAKAIARRALAGGEKRSCGTRHRHARDWAIAAASFDGLLDRHRRLRCLCAGSGSANRSALLRLVRSSTATAVGRRLRTTMARRWCERSRRLPSRLDRAGPATRPGRTWPPLATGGPMNGVRS
jgi:hypothetical protein